MHATARQHLFLAGTVAGLALFTGLGGACGKAEVASTGEGRPGAGAGGATTGAGAAGPSVVLPGSDAAATTPTSGDPSTCASESHMAERVAVDLLLLVDVSSSMANVVAGGTQTKWQVAHTALTSFINDARSAELNVAMAFFPLGASCALGDYARPAVALGALPGGAPPLLAALDAQNVRTNFGTPTGVAVTGALQYLRQQLAAQPGHKAVLVLVTDGEPTSCAPLFIDEIAVPVAEAQRMSPSIPTHVVGVFTPAELARSRATVDRLAAAGGTMPFVLSATADLPKQLGDALEQVRNVAVPCEFVIPPPRKDALDYGKVNLRFSRAAGEENIPYVQSADRCPAARGGWYYDVDPAGGGRPTRVVVCPSTCQAFKSEARAKVELVFGCKTISID